MAATAELKAKLSLNDQQYQAALRRSQGAAVTAGKVMGGALRNVGTGAMNFLSNTVRGFITGPLAGMGAAFGAAFAGRAVYSGIKNVWDMGAGLKLLHEQTGANLGGLAQIKTAYGAAGVESDGLGMSINRLQKQIEAGGDVFGKLGLSLDAIKRLSPDKQFAAVGRAIADINDPAARAATAMQIFGRSGGELLAVFQNPAFRSVGGELTGKAKVLADNADVFYQSSRALAKASNIFKGFYIGAAGGLGAGMLPILNKLGAIDLVGIGQGFGRGLAYGAQILTDMLSELGKTLQADLRDIENMGSILSQMGRGFKRTFTPNVQMVDKKGNVIGDSNDPAKATSAKSEGVTVNGDGSMFKSKPIGFQGDGLQWGSTMQRVPRPGGGEMDQRIFTPPYQSSFERQGGKIYNETSYGALGDARPDNAGGTAAHDAGWGQGGLQTGAAYTQARMAKINAAQQAKQDAAKGQTVNAPTLEELMRGLKTSVDNFADK